MNCAAEICWKARAAPFPRSILPERSSSASPLAVREISLKEASAIKRSDTYDIFGMLMKIGGWEKYSGNKNASLKRGFYGTQRCFVRTQKAPADCLSENATQL